MPNLLQFLSLKDPESWHLGSPLQREGPQPLSALITVLQLLLQLLCVGIPYFSVKSKAHGQKLRMTSGIDVPRPLL